MQMLVGALLAAGYTLWGDHQRLGEERRDRSVRCNLPRLPPPPGARLSGNALEDFTRQCFVRYSSNP
jgi:hypothetical protein